MQRDVGATIKRFGNCLEREAKKAEQHLHKKGADITRSQGAVLGFIYSKYCQNINVYQKDIERAFDLRRPSATNILNRLEIKGYIKRIKESFDARTKRLELTRKGMDFIGVVKEDVLLFEKKIIEGISKKELDTLYSVIEKMTDNLKNEE